MAAKIKFTAKSEIPKILNLHCSNDDHMCKKLCLLIISVSSQAERNYEQSKDWLSCAYITQNNPCLVSALHSDHEQDKNHEKWNKVLLSVS